MTATMPLEILLLFGGAVLVGASMVLAPLYGIVTGRLKYSAQSNTFKRGKDGQELSVGPVLATMLIGALLVMSPVIGYYLSFDKTQLAEQKETLSARVVALENEKQQCQAELAGKVDPPKYYTFSGRVEIDFPEGATIPFGADDLTRVRVQPFYPGAHLTEDGKFTLQFLRNANGQLPHVAVIYPTTGTDFRRGIRTFTSGELEEEPGGTGLLRIANSPMRENVVRIELARKPPSD